MTQLICRFSTRSSDAELLRIENQKEIWKSVSVDELIRKIEKFGR